MDDQNGCVSARKKNGMLIAGWSTKNIWKGGGGGGAHPVGQLGELQILDHLGVGRRLHRPLLLEVRHLGRQAAHVALQALQGHQGLLGGLVQVLLQAQLLLGVLQDSGGLLLECRLVGELLPH